MTQSNGEPVITPAPVPGAVSTITEPVTTVPEPALDTNKTFTQDEVNRITGQRVLEERGKTADYEDLKAKAAKFDEVEAAKLSTEERLTAEVAEAKQATANAGAKVTEMAITTAIQVKAAQMGLQSPDDALALVTRAGIGFTEETGVTGVAEALDALIAAKPYLKGAVAGAPNMNANGGAPTPVAVGLTDAEREISHKFNRHLPIAEREAEYAKGKR